MPVSSEGGVDEGWMIVVSVFGTSSVRAMYRLTFPYVSKRRKGTSWPCSGTGDGLWNPLDAKCMNRLAALSADRRHGQIAW